MLPSNLVYAPSHAGRFARVASWVGLVAGGLLLSGSIAIALVDDRDSESVTRGLHLGLSAAAAPFVALGGWTARKRAKVEGYDVTRKLGWASYTGAIALGAGAFYGSFNDIPTSKSLTIGGGVLAAMSVLPLAFDAYVCARHAHLRELQFVVTPLGISGRF